MYAEERQNAIATLVMQQGRASVTELAQTYDVTTETVRRDLAVLHKAGLLRRVHGGAVPARALHLVEQDVGERDVTRSAHKDAIAAAATDVFPVGGASVLLDAGTTTSRVAALIPTDRELVVVTNSVPVAARLSTVQSVSLQLLGGRVRGTGPADPGADQGGHRLHRHQRHHRPARSVHTRQRGGRHQAGDGQVCELCCRSR
jgi:DeoR family transcriptional regulator, fructose operon transcriptional repressor